VKKKWFSLNQIQRVLNLAGVQVKKFKPCRGDVDKFDWRMKLRVKGVHVMFKNDVTLSIQWGGQNYCDQGLTSCEVMAWDENDTPLCIPGFLEPQHFDQVIGHVDREDLILIVKACANMTEKINKKLPSVLED
jgi:hypothetical protein